MSLHFTYNRRSTPKTLDAPFSTSRLCRKSSSAGRRCHLLHSDRRPATPRRSPSTPSPTVDQDAVMRSQNQNNRTCSSANIPFEIQSEIIKRVLPVKSLLRFRSVSKQWKSLIDSSEFIADHSVNQAHQHHLLVRYEVGFDYKYVSIVDDDDDHDCFPQNKFSPVVSPTVNLVGYAHLLDSSRGLVCFYGYDSCGKITIVIWNPSIRKSVAIELSPRSATLGFGVCPKTNDPKIVMITRSSYQIEPVTWKAEVFTLSSGAWRSISMNMDFSSSTRFKSQQVVIDGVIHWAATSDSSNADCVYRIISFDLVSEEFREVDLPDSLACGTLSISKLNKSLVVLHFDDDDDDDIDEFEVNCDIWMMMATKNGFEKLFSVGIKVFDGYKLYGIVGFRRNGQPIRENRCEDDGSLGTTLEAYDPSTKHICDLGIYIDSESAPFKITSYTESLLLLNNHSDYIV